jgi:crotonobetainyl-CoA:carnitine CoA-transferase CaiB-like acyl-CoA transferase
MVIQVKHPVEGEFKALGFPVKMRGTPQEVRLPPPLIDEHGDEIRRELIERGLLEPQQETAK